MVNPKLKEKLAELPASPGVYIMRDADGQVVYVGKAKSLKQRVRSYFQAESRLAPKTAAQMRVDCRILGHGSAGAGKQSD